MYERPLARTIRKDSRTRDLVRRASQTRAGGALPWAARSSSGLLRRPLHPQALSKDGCGRALHQIASPLRPPSTRLCRAGAPSAKARAVRDPSRRRARNRSQAGVSFGGVIRSECRRRATAWWTLEALIGRGGVDRGAGWVWPADARLGPPSQLLLAGDRLPAANMRNVLARPSATSTIEMMRSLFSPADVSCLGGG